MKDAAAKSAKNTKQNKDAEKTMMETIKPPSAQTIAAGTPLDRCYGQIGISAVAAAARYQGGAKNPAYAPVAIKPFTPADEAA